ncbi:MAG: bifunctional [glutamate--ammonia ligase]-adenylyl-L-tyrosine phosphorylase/[glutamate--ammonia-ligase] adenylyltransferase [Candidatus Abyssobacteria bacterium SURF_5]|uniref:Bifunctional [glutamate--ammonia ligase]-adenylyl-L-tyrosine phosphorylase/[glutamate--ammonia-ligase] adenylyltransferase n=1 Tax=Abyssobacteria bacterium (strain SURF_5) TaxID=2093360 RepID=A0A3A4N3S1_ABYX5|nr:MAG: bifunctional [glutamate--ammonia ligase]-adenylyl-L-tyrosine phosphorylase/[glutamate--ammonia-ligase] adenylyltransferase [Candidatus Abyssubacteria bacterium SURF_5]
MQEHERLAEIFFTEKIPFDSVRRVLTGAGIRDPVTADKNLKLLAGHGPGYELFCRILPDVLQELSSAADPDMALNNWERLVEVIRDRESHFNYLAAKPRVLGVLLKILGASQYLSDILIRQPHLFLSILSDDFADTPADRESLRSELSERLEDAPDYLGKLDVLREFNQRQMLHIGARDICGKVDVEAILKETTALADICIEAAFESAQSEVLRRHGIPGENETNRRAAAVVLAFGKLGGEELNYSSDIDLMFMYSNEGETRAGAPDQRIEPISNHQFFSKVAEKCIDLLSRVTDRGHLYRVDMRLRPMGSKGPLVSSLESHLNYYEIFGETWERQALLKTRPVAGDLALAQAFLTEIRPFVYPKYLDHRGIREIQNLKRRSEIEVDKHGRTLTEVKLGRGGIRDIEFIVQFLQLLHGGKNEQLRGVNTLTVLRKLEQIGYLTSAEFSSLVDAYKFLRRLENRLQIMQNRQLHVLPTDAESLQVIARSLGYRDQPAKSAGEALADEHRRQTGRVRELFNKFFSKLFSADEHVSPVVDLMMNPEPDQEEIRSALSRYGFRNPSVAYVNLRFLADGPPQSPYTSRARTFFSSIAPLLIQYLSQSPDPDMGLTNLQQCITAMGAPSNLYEVLSTSPKSIELFVALASYSDYLIRLFVNDPGVLDFLMSTRILEEESSRELIDRALGKFLEINPNFYESIQRFKNGEILRIGLRDILGLADIAEVIRELSSVAEVMLERVYRQCLAEELARFGQPRADDNRPATLAILGLGKLGGGEINYASDLDIIFVYSADGGTGGGTADAISNQQFFNALAARIMKRMAEVNPYGYLYKLDARLRPDGEQGLLAVSADAFMEYHRRKSALWEKRAMTKLRPVAGDAHLGERLKEFVQALIYQPGFFSADVVRDAAQMLSKIFANARTEEHEGVQIKNAEGGIIEIEFLVQLLQIKYGDGLPELRTPNTLEALDRLARTGRIPRQAHDDLIAGLVFLRRIENRLRLMHDRPLKELPAEVDALNKLALRLGIRAAADRDPAEMLLDTLHLHVQRSHRVFVEMMKELEETK